MLRRTKIVATLGPASSDQKVLEQMIRAGVDVVRMNFSHGTAQDHENRAKLVKELATKTGRTVACRLRAEPMERANEWLNRYQRFWTERLDQLAAFLEEDECPPQPPLNQASPSSVVSMRRPKKSTPRGPNPRT